MARPSKLDERDCVEIQRRLALGGEGNTVGAIAKEFKVSKATISSRFSKRTETVQLLATTLATTEEAISKLSINEQCSVRTLADQLKGISASLAKAAGHGANVAARLAEISEKHLNSLGDGVLDPTNELAQDGVKQVMKLTTVANESSKLGMGLLAANKGKADAGLPTLEDLVTGGQR